MYCILLYCTALYCAAKFTRAGIISITAGMREDGQYVYVSVADTGGAVQYDGETVHE